MEDKRRYKRFIVEGMDIHAKTLFATEVEFVDVSLGGACIRGTKRLNIGGDYFLKIQGKHDVYRLRCSVVWEKLTGSKKSPNGDVVPVYTAGIQFQDTMSDSTKGLLEYIETHCNEAERRLGGLRFKIAPDEKTFIRYTETNQVKKISIGGILIETDHEYPLDSKVTLELDLPEEGRPIHLEGRVASCYELPNRKPVRYDVGLEFTRISEADTERLDRFLRMLNDINESASSL